MSIQYSPAKGGKNTQGPQFEKKIKHSISRKARQLPPSNKTKRTPVKETFSFINSDAATDEKHALLNQTKRHISSVKKDINEQLQIAQNFMNMLTSELNPDKKPILTPTHLMNVRYDEFEHIVIIDNQNLYYSHDITEYKTPRDMVLDLAQLMGHLNLFIIVKPKLDPKQLDYYHDKDNANIITFNIDCTTLNNERMQQCSVVHGFNESDDYLLLLLYKYFITNHKKANNSNARAKRSQIQISILSGDNYKHTRHNINYFYLDEKLKWKKFNQRAYYEQFSKPAITNRLTEQIQDDIGWY